MEEVFKSPIKKLIQFFEKSRDKWKKRAKKAIKEVRANKKRIQFLETSKNSLKNKVHELKEKNKALENSVKDNKKKRQKNNLIKKHNQLSRTIKMKQK